MNREKKIIQTSIIGILANILLAAFKAFVGIATNSIAVTMDAINNLSDALSSVITIVATKLAGKAPDKKHPFGYGRIEYLSAMIISVIVLYAGITALKESVQKIIHPETASYTTVSLVIIAVAVVVKLVLGQYVKKTGQKVNSESLIASGTDALMDSIISISTLVAAAIYLIFGISLEAWLGAIISVVIIKSGIDMLRESIGDILGKRIEMDLSVAVKATVNSFPEVHGTYDLALHSYGPETLIGSLHIEVDDSLTMNELDTLQRQIIRKVHEEHDVILEGISIYSRNTTDVHTDEMYDAVKKVVFAHEQVRGTHGFYLNEKTKEIHFDMVLSYNYKPRKELFAEILKEVQDAFPGYYIEIHLDGDFSD